MSSILYIGKDYCHSLEQLQQFFRNVTSAEDSLYQELLTLQRDGLIAQWLEEGDENEKALAKQIRGLSPSLTNRDIMEKLGELMTNRNAAYVVNLLSYVELKNVSYALREASSVEVKYKKIAIGDIIAVDEKYLQALLRLKLTFKVVKPEKEIFHLKAIISWHDKKIADTTTELRLNNEPIGKEVVITIDIPMSQIRKDAEAPYMLEIRDESQLLFSAKVAPEGSGMFTANGVKFKMIRVEGGSFDMDTNYHVTLSDYYIGETQVTQALWKAVMGSNPSWFKGDNKPVESVSWDDCQAFIEKLNSKLSNQLPRGCKFRLPTEAQWEFAARGGKKSNGFEYAGSDNIDEVAWYDDNSDDKTHPVKGKKANELGLYDMSGNVWEWCQDWYDSYSSGSQTDPTGPSGGSYRVLRGGSWYYGARDCRVASRSNGSPDGRNYGRGIRLSLVHQ